MNLKYIDIHNGSELILWNEFVDNSPQGSIFSKSWYLEALHVNFKILVVLKNDRIIAGIILAKNQLNTWSNPLLDKYLGVLFKEKQLGVSQKVLSEQFKALDILVSELTKYKSFDYYFHPNFQNWAAFYWKGFTQQTRYTYRVDLSISIDNIKKSFHGNLRNDLKNALNNEIVIKQNVDFNSFYDIINKTFLRQGSKSPYSQQWLKQFIDEIKEKRCFVSFGAYNKLGELISVCGLVFDNKSAYFILNGIDIEKQVRGANALMIVDAIKHSQNKEINYFDFEGSMLPGVEQFYRRFGGELVPYYRIWKDNFFNYAKSAAKKMYKKYRYGR